MVGRRNDERLGKRNKGRGNVRGYRKVSDSQSRRVMEQSV